MNTVFKLEDEELFNAKLFRAKHKRIGCKFKNFLGFEKRELQSEGPTYSYIFKQTQIKGKERKFIRCNFCGEEIEITKKDKESNK